MSLLVVIAAACGQASVMPGPDGGSAGSRDAGAVVGVGPYCDVQREVFIPACGSCHTGPSQPPDLSFAGARTALVGIVSQAHAGRIFVTAGEPASSFLFAKITGQLASDEGSQMPTDRALSPAQIEIVRRWIQDGASFECSSPVDGGTQTYHSSGYADPSVHGAELKHGAQDCRSCHGSTLEGGAGPSCDGCHQQDWRTTCTYCHGGTDSDTGAPPRDLSGETTRDQLRFRAHTEHTRDIGHAPYDCTQCHLKPTDVLSEGHVFDDTPGASEVIFRDGLSPAGQYNGQGACGNLYCHGNGRTSPGSYDHTRPTPDCGTCHAGPSSTRARWATMSGAHARHLREGFGCVECHASVVDAQNGFADANLHVDGQKQVVFNNNGATRTNGRCSGTCHNELHRSRAW